MVPVHISKHTFTRSQSYKDKLRNKGKHCRRYLHEIPRIVKFIVRKYTGRCQRQGWSWGLWPVGSEDDELVFHRDRVSVQEGEKLGRWMMVRVGQHMKVLGVIEL